MALITIKKLQREFGLSYVTAAGIIREQSRLARKRYRMLSAFLSCGWLIFVGLTFAGIHLPHGAQRWMPAAMLPLVAWQHYLITRASRVRQRPAGQRSRQVGGRGPPPGSARARRA